jgi:hypothetical protein
VAVLAERFVLRNMAHRMTIESPVDKASDVDERDPIFHVLPISDPWPFLEVDQFFKGSDGPAARHTTDEVICVHGVHS